MTPSLGYANSDNSFLSTHKIEMIKSIIEYVNFYFPSYKTQFYNDNFIKSCLVYQFLYEMYFKQKLDISQIIYRLSDSRHNFKSKSPTIINHLIFSLAFREFWKRYKLGRGCVYISISPFKEFELLGCLTGIIYWCFHRRTYGSPYYPLPWATPQ